MVYRMRGEPEPKAVSGHVNSAARVIVVELEQQPAAAAAAASSEPEQKDQKSAAPSSKEHDSAAYRERLLALGSQREIEVPCHHPALQHSAERIECPRLILWWWLWCGGVCVSSDGAN